MEELKIMLPRTWESAMLRSQATAGFRTLTGFVRELVELRLDEDGVTIHRNPRNGNPDPAAEVTGGITGWKAGVK